jgi:hypothetical protein
MDSDLDCNITGVNATADGNIYIYCQHHLCSTTEENIMDVAQVDSDFEIVMHIQGIENSTLETLNVFLAPGNCISKNMHTEKYDTWHICRWCCCCCCRDRKDGYHALSTTCNE